jgi:hypothetical protein
MNDLIAIAKNVGAGTAPLSFSSWGLLCAKYTDNFHPPLNTIAQGVCFVVMVVGVGFAAWIIGRKSIAAAA